MYLLRLGKNNNVKSTYDNNDFTAICALCRKTHKERIDSEAQCTADNDNSSNEELLER